MKNSAKRRGKFETEGAEFGNMPMQKHRARADADLPVGRCSAPAVRPAAFRAPELHAVVEDDSCSWPPLRVQADPSAARVCDSMA
jgi:hypothetical protein